MKSVTATSPTWRLRAGRLCAEALHSTATSTWTFGDGRSRTRSNAYIDASSYLAIFGSEGHEYFAFNHWETPVCFDNLVTSPLGG